MEGLFGEWLDEHFYSLYRDRYKVLMRSNDHFLQKKGIDVIIRTKDDKMLYIDEKATLHYINRHIPTFAFEIKNMTSGNIGWLFNPDYVTTHYTLCWPDGNENGIFTKDDYYSSEIMTIKRSSVIQLLSDNGLDEAGINRMVDSYQGESKLKITDDISLYFNNTLRERPINVVIKKDLLKRYATLHTTIYA